MKIALVVALLVCTSGCVSHQFPKDAAIIGASQASGVWGHGEIKGTVLTGKAATPENVKAAAEALPDVLK